MDALQNPLSDTFTETKGAALQPPAKKQKPLTHTRLPRYHLKSSHKANQAANVSSHLNMLESRRDRISLAHASRELLTGTLKSGSFPVRDPHGHYHHGRGTTYLPCAVFANRRRDFAIPRPPFTADRSGILRDQS